MRSFWQIPILGPLTFTFWRMDAQRKFHWFNPVTPAMSNDKPRIIEIGSGPGSIISVMNDHGFSVTGIDIRDSSYKDDLSPILYDGSRIPYEDDSFDVALLLTMLHHTPNPENILYEAGRIAKTIIIVEDIYTSSLHRKITKVADSLMNLEFIGHPHTNRNDSEWQDTFEKIEFQLIHTSQKRLAYYFLQALYVLDSTGMKKRT